MNKTKLLGAGLIAIALATAAQSQTVPKKSSNTANMKPLYGNIDPFFGDIGAFWGDISPFYGNIDPFWGDLNPFYGDIGAFWGDLNPFFGDIGAFSRASTPSYQNIGEFWKTLGPDLSAADREWSTAGLYSANPGKYQALRGSLEAIVTRSEVIWGDAVKARTGKSFRAGFADAVFAKHGVSLSNLSSLENMSASQRSRLFLDWYDGLMDYSGTDHVDHWMRTANWSPSLTHVQGAGSRTIIGLLDSTIAGDPDIASNITSASGFVNVLGGHGTGVAGLLVADHDGKGVMGIAPRASVVAYNPFDESGTASWADVTSGIFALGKSRASVINMSLGVPGSTLHKDWLSIFANPLVSAVTRNTVFVIAAGNDGMAQTGNIPWTLSNDPKLIVVGSVDPNEKISVFSNTPGTACLLKAGLCLEQNRLYNRFIVAPGEMILVSDGKGGIVRRSGTSFAAPMVSGAIALLHDRWPWLAAYAQETVDIVLRSAKDLGAPGVDPVYGRGLLDIEASQSPLDFSKLTYYEERNGMMMPKTVAAVRLGGVKPSWQADGVFYHLFEKIGRTHRDFIVPLSSRLVGQTTTLTGSNQYFQGYITSRLTDWLGKGLTGFNDVRDVSMTTGQNWTMRLSGSRLSPQLASNEDSIATPSSSVTIGDADGRLSFTAGYGQGAMAFGGRSGFGLTSDHSSTSGGVNPVLAFASGGSFAGADVALADGLKLSAGMTEQRLVHSRLQGLAPTDRAALTGIDPYRANAINLTLTRDFSRHLSVSATYTRLDEQAGLLGVQSVAESDLRHGSMSDATTLAAKATFGGSFTIAGSATAARTRSGNATDQSLTTVESGVLSSAYAVAISKAGVLGKRDQMRFSIAQPLHIERGALSYNAVQIIDRATGEIGSVASEFDIGGQPRRLITELLYAAPVTDGAGEFSLFGRTEFRTGSETSMQGYVVGGRFGIAF